MYVRDLKGGKPPVFKTIKHLCAPDCGGEDYDEIEYAPFCSECDKHFYSCGDKFCSNCGTKIFWDVTWPEFEK